MPLSAQQLKTKRAYRQNKADKGEQRIVSYIPKMIYDEIVKTQEDLGLRTRGHAISAIVAEWIEIKQFKDTGHE